MMKNFKKQNFLKSQAIERIIIVVASIVLLYLLISLYFAKHFLFNTVINGVDVSLKSHVKIDNLFITYTNDYQLQLIERMDETEVISGKEIGLHYNKKNSISNIVDKQKSMNWIKPIFKKQKYHVNDVFALNKGKLENKIDRLNCLNKNIVEPENVRFKYSYSKGFYVMIKEEYGNKVNRDKLMKAVEISILKGETILDVDKNLCYENPKYTLNSEKSIETMNLLNKYVNSKVTYLFGSKKEIIDGNIINRCLIVDENLEVFIDEKEVMEYVKVLGSKYDTVGTTRKFKTSNGKIVEVKGGIYGWKISIAAETKALLEIIKLGEVIEKEPKYSQKAHSREKDDIGNTYVEINITRQHIWFYKDGKLIIDGAIVTGNPSKGYSTKLGTFMLNYKIKGATLKGPGYAAKVTYWMPFYGNIGLHDASWRNSFGGDIYRRRGSHGCVNAPLYLAKTIYEYIEEGTPIICYEE